MKHKDKKRLYLLLAFLICSQMDASASGANYTDIQNLNGNRSDFNDALQSIKSGVSELDNNAVYDFLINQTYDGYDINPYNALSSTEINALANQYAVNQGWIPAPPTDTNVYTPPTATTTKLPGGESDTTYTVTDNGKNYTVDIVDPGNGQQPVIVAAPDTPAYVIAEGIISNALSKGLITHNNDGTVTINGVTLASIHVALKAEQTVTASIQTRQAMAGKPSKQSAQSIGLTVRSIMGKQNEISSPSSNGFSGKPILTSALFKKNLTTDEKLESLCNALAQTGPVNVNGKQIAAWIAPLINIGNFGDAQMRNFGFGTLAGAAYKSDSFMIGLFAGFNTSKETSRVTVNSVKSNGTTLGLYGTKKAWKGASIGGSYSFNLTKSKHREFDGLVVNQDSQYINTNAIDLHLMQSFKFGSGFSVGGTLGNLMVISNSDSFLTYSSTNGVSQEAYLGVNFGWGRRSGERRFSIDTSYVYGYEYKNTTKSPSSTVNLCGLTLDSIAGTGLSKKRTHQVGVNLGLEQNKSLRLDVGYQGTYSGRDQNHTALVKIEYKF